MTPSNQTQNKQQTSRKWLILLLALATLIMLLLDRPLVRGDGVAYLAWVDSFVLDRDIDFGNQLERLAPVNTYQIQWNETTQKLVNIFPFGVALIQAPFYAIGHWFAVNGWWDANPDYFHLNQGIWRPYSLWLMIGANVIGLLMLAITWRLVKQLVSGRLATLLVLAFFMGTPLVYYFTVSPLNSHGAGGFALAVFLALVVRTNGGFKVDGAAPPPKQPIWVWLAIGVSAGLVVLARWQLLIVVAPAWPILLWRQRWRGPLIAMVAAAITLLPLPFIWNDFFGAPFVIPYDAQNSTEASTAFLTLRSNVLGVLLQTILHSPIIVLSLVGWPFLWRVNQRWAVYAAVVIGLQLWLNGGVLDWWAGETYGMRRMSELFPIYAIMAAALAQAWQSAEPHRLRWLHAILLISLVYSLLYFTVFMNFTWTTQTGVFIDDPLTMFQHFGQQAHRWQISAEVWRTHLGPLAWSMPGP